MSYWDELARPAPEAVVVDGVELRARSRVRLRPRPGGDIMDLALAGRTAIVEGIDQDTDGNVSLAVVVADDPGRELGELRQPGHRFFFAPDEVEPAGEDGAAGRDATRCPAPTRVLVAGIGNAFLGDDGFGVALADRLARRALPAGVEVVDFGIRGLDLAYAMQDEALEAVVLLDAAPRGLTPGTVSVLEPDLGGLAPDVDAHGMDPVKVLALAREVGGRLPRTLLVCCEPQTRMTGAEDEVVIVLSAPVAAALEPAAAAVLELVDELVAGQPGGGGS
jgi:hydrogenase maturation protease